ncbi:putative phospholipid-transporting ATPase 9 [Salvia divinorum]|uniref:Phospholipid-transporting ATPase n=1 Tax=Salvia divinorum TaxID=28513 RepID=A0ABD1IN10_SALDI
MVKEGIEDFQRKKQDIEINNRKVKVHQAARELGFEFFKRTQTSVLINELNLVTRQLVERSYKLLNILEFNSARKRMSVIVRDEEGKLLLLCKGADSVMFERLSNNGRQYEEKTREHCNEYADAGLRTLILACATAVEDKLQQGVPECIDKLARAGIKLWVLTGDKMETAINIGYACSLLRQGMKQIIITLESPEIKALEKNGEKSELAMASKDSVLRQITEGKAQVAKITSEAFALIIDGKSLAYALEDDVKKLFLELAVGCASVICCRSSPKQKALVTRLVKDGTTKTTLAIGDGANDVGMLQEADIGIGISGVEGMQAVMSSDIAIAQFRFLEHLLLVHGHWCYRRISTMICYFFYKNITFGITIFLYEAYTSFSGQPAYNDWFLSFYNVLFTSMPVIALGVFDQDVSARFCLKFPMLYQEGVQNLLFSWHRVTGWMLNGLGSAVIIFFFCAKALSPEAFNEEGKTADFQIFGATIKFVFEATSFSTPKTSESKLTPARKIIQNALDFRHAAAKVKGFCSKGSTKAVLYLHDFRSSFFAYSLVFFITLCGSFSGMKMTICNSTKQWKSYVDE